MTERYFVSPPITGNKAVLSGPEAHHAQVMRLRAGQPVSLFDGSGAEFDAQVVTFTRSEVHVAVLARREVDRELPGELTLAVALPKGERQKWLVEKAVELGVTRIVPLLVKHCVVQPDENTVERLKRAVIEASKQCGRNRLLAMEAAVAWPDFLASTRQAACRLLAHPAEAHPVPPRDRDQLSASIASANQMIAAVGPEGGFTDDEVAQAVAAGWQPIDLGPRILRVETAALALASIVAGGWRR